MNYNKGNWILGYWEINLFEKLIRVCYFSLIIPPFRQGEAGRGWKNWLGQIKLFFRYL